jgi:GT2 family glycosyltransferase
MVTNAPKSISRGRVISAGLEHKIEAIAEAPLPEVAWPCASVVVATHERAEHLARCLEHLVALDYPNFEIIVVDNAPRTDATRAVVEMMAKHAVRYIAEPTKGASVARNTGVVASRGTVVAFTDDDVRVDRGWLRALVRPLVNDPTCECVTGLVLPAELETDAQVWFEEFGGFNKGFVPRRFDLGRNRWPGPLYPYSPGMFGSGNNAVFRQSTLERLAGFDPCLGPGTPTCGGEDLDLFLKVIVGGGRLAYEPNAITYHVHRREYEMLRAQIHDYGVGLSALLTKWMTADPRHAWQIARRAPAGLKLLLGGDSPKNDKKSVSFPAQLTHQELIGLLRGPWAYVRSRQHPPKAGRSSC